MLGVAPGTSPDGRIPDIRSVALDSAGQEALQWPSAGPANGASQNQVGDIAYRSAMWGRPRAIGAIAEQETEDEKDCVDCGTCFRGFERSRLGLPCGRRGPDVGRDPAGRGHFFWFLKARRFKF